MAFNQIYDSKYGNYDDVLPIFDLSSNSFNTVASTSSKHENSEVSFNSFLGSDSSSLTASSIMPLPSHIYGKFLMSGFAPISSASITSYNDVSPFMGINPLDVIGQQDVDMNSNIHIRYQPEDL